MNGAVRAVVFDFDGVCIDTETARFLAWKRKFEQYGFELPLEEWVKNIGTATWVSDPFILLEELTGRRIDRAGFEGGLRRSELEIADSFPLQPGLKDRLEEAAGLGISCAIASSSSHQWVDGHLQRRGLTGMFRTTVCREDTSEHKPHPEPYLTALRRLGIPAENGIAIEDSPLGLMSAHSAGLYCIAVPSVLTKHMDFSAAHRVVASLEEVSLSHCMHACF